MTYVFRSMLVLVFSILILSSALAQSDSPTLYVKVDYMKVAPGNEEDYVNVERTTWKPIHEARMKAGIITNWSLYSVEYPYGTNADYTYATVNIYDDFSKMKDDYPESVMQTAHPDVNENQFGEMMAKTLASRDLVRSELWVMHDSVQPDQPAPYIHVNYMKVPSGQGQEYLKLEREIWKPVHQAAKDAGHRAGWAVYSLMYPGGTQRPYNYGTVDFFDEFSDLVVGIPEEVFKKAHPSASEEGWDEIWQRTANARDLVRRELWALVDQVAAPSATTSK